MKWTLTYTERSVNNRSNQGEGMPITKVNEEELLDRLNQRVSGLRL